MTYPNIKVPNETFASIAQQVDAHKELSDFGKAITVLLVYLAHAMEQGAAEADIDLIIACIKPGVLETAARVIRETAPHASEHQ